VNSIDGKSLIHGKTTYLNEAKQVLGNDLMLVNINPEPIEKGYGIVRTKCPNCSAEFVFRVTDKEVIEVLGDGVANPRDKTVKCKTCLSTFKYEVFEPSSNHVGFSPQT